MTTPVVDPYEVAGKVVGDAYTAYENAAETYIETAFKAFAEVIRAELPKATHAIVEIPEVNAMASWSIEVDGEEREYYDGDADYDALVEWLNDNTPSFLETRPYSLVQPFTDPSHPEDFDVERHTDLLNRARMSLDAMLAGPTGSTTPPLAP